MRYVTIGLQSATGVKMLIDWRLYFRFLGLHRLGIDDRSSDWTDVVTSVSTAIVRRFNK